MLQLLKLGRWDYADPQQCFIAQGDSLDAVLARDLVRVAQDRYVHEQINRCRVRTSAAGSEDYSNPFTVSRHIEAPERLMSRDQFVSISTRLFVRNRIALASLIRPDIDPIEALTAIECRRVAHQGSAVDFRVEVRMARAGIEIKTTDEASGRNATDRIEWTEILGIESD